MANDNTEREMQVSRECPGNYSTLASELIRAINESKEAPPTIATSPDYITNGTPLIVTTSGKPVALRASITPRQGRDEGNCTDPIVLMLPPVTNLDPWFTAFLADVHAVDPGRVPQAPPRLSNPQDWFAPEEQALADKIAAIESELANLEEARNRLKVALEEAGERIDKGVRSAIWEDGDELVEAVGHILQDLGFTVRNMDVELSPNDSKREDLRLTLDCHSDWEAIVEVKGYTKGTRSNDARQIREHRELYIAEEGRAPDLTLWLGNPFRMMNPDLRSAPTQDLRSRAEMIGCVYALTTDLYKEWADSQMGRRPAEEVIRSLMDVGPGIWSPTSQRT